MRERYLSQQTPVLHMALSNRNADRLRDPVCRALRGPWRLSGLARRMNDLQAGPCNRSPVIAINDRPDLYRSEKWCAPASNFYKEWGRVTLAATSPTGQHLRLQPAVTLAQSLALTPGQRLTIRYLPSDPNLARVSQRRTRRPRIWPGAARCRRSRGHPDLQPGWASASCPIRPSTSIDVPPDIPLKSKRPHPRRGPSSSRSGNLT